jgi:hypothetical protein
MREAEKQAKEGGADEREGHTKGDPPLSRGECIME